MTTMIISNVHPRGFAFGITENGEQVFIPPFLSKGAKLQAGDTVEAKLTINPQQRQRELTPYLAVKIEGSNTEYVEEEISTETPEEEVSIEMRDEAIFNLIRESDYMTSAELAEHSGFDSKTVGNSALRLFNAGRIAKADVYNRVGQARASFTLWAENANKFVD
jgi:hypothetical protein